MPPRIKDIADYVGLSSSTVSMILNNRPGFSEATRSLVTEAAKKLNYQSTSTKRLATDAMNNLPFVIYRRHGEVIGETAFFSALIESLENEAKCNGYNLSIHYLHANDRSLAKSLLQIASQSDVGLLVLGTEMNQDDAEEIVNCGVPFVLMDNAMFEASCNKVLIDNIQGAFLAVSQLHKYGHRKIGYLHSNVWISNFDERNIGFRFAMYKHGLELREDWIAHIGSMPESAYHGMLNYLNHAKELPTAFFADNDIIAVGAIKAMKERGYHIPEDISVIGFDDTPYCTMLTPNLSTMRVNTRDLGRTAVELLLNGNAYSRKIVMETQFVSRESVKAL